MSLLENLCAIVFAIYTIYIKYVKNNIQAEYEARMERLRQAEMDKQDRVKAKIR